MRVDQVERMRMYWAAKYKPVFLSALKSQNAQFIKLAIESPEQAVNRANDIYTREPMKRAFVGLYGDLGGASAKYTRSKYQKEWRERIRTKADESMWDDQFATSMRAYAVTAAGDRITGITGTSKEIAIRILRSLMEQAQREGIGNDQLSQFLRDNLEKEFSRFERWRADRIVNTETLTAQQRGAMDGAKSLGIDMKKQWIAYPGLAQTAERHAIMPGVNGQTVEMNMPFIVGGEALDHPGDPNGSAENVINCRCDVVFIPK